LNRGCVFVIKRKKRRRKNTPDPPPPPPPRGFNVLHSQREKCTEEKEKP